MSLRSEFNNALGSTIDHATDIVQRLRTTMSQITGEVTTGFSNIFDGGFVGMSESGLEMVKYSISSYIASVQEAIDEYNSDATLELSFRGAISDSAKEFIEAVKIMLDAYVSSLKAQLDEIDTAYAAFQNADTDVAANVSSNAESIRSNAEEINID